MVAYLISSKALSEMETIRRYCNACFSVTKASSGKSKIPSGKERNMTGTVISLKKNKQASKDYKCEALKKEWINFIKGNNPDPKTTHVRPIIREAWRRCKEKRIDPFKGNLHYQTGLEKAQKNIRDNENLIELSTPFMHNLLEIVGDAGALILLADGNLNFVNIIAEENSLIPKNLNDMKGMNFGEDFVGNNALSMCKDLGKPIQISGAEHYCEFFHPYACSASPIYSQNGKLMGIMNITMNCHDAHPHTLGMVTAATHAIGATLGLFEAKQKITVAHNFLKSAIQAHENGILIIDEAGFIKFSNLENNKNIFKDFKSNITFKKKNLYNLLDPKIINDVLTNGKTFSKIENRLFLPEGESMIVLSA